MATVLKREQVVKITRTMALASKVQALRAALTLLASASNLYKLIIIIIISNNIYKINQNIVHNPSCQINCICLFLL